MNLLKTLSYVLVFIIIALYLAGFKLSFKPFKIEFISWYNFIGWILLITAMLFLNIGTYLRAYRKGAEDMTKEIKIHLEQKDIERQAMIDLNK